MTDQRGVAGGKARAKALSAKARSESASNAANNRWLLKATHGSPDHPLKIGEIEIPCYVLENGQRVIVVRGMARALDISPSGGDEDRITRFVHGKKLKPFVSQDLLMSMKPVKFLAPSAGRYALGFEATVLAGICDALLAARKAGALSVTQKHIADRAEILLRGFARVGIIALVDEATGYQESRDRDALQAILDRYLRHELAAWAKCFPDDFYRHIFRLRGWTWRGMSVNRPQVVAHYTKDLVYARLAPSILTELEERTPKDNNGRRGAKFHQWLTDDVGHPALAQHLWATMGFMRLVNDGEWDRFMGMMDKAFPKRGDTLQLPFMSEDPV